MDEYKSNASNLNDRIKPGRLVPNSVHAVKNGRRKMEDRHVVIHDLNVIYSGPKNDVSKHQLCSIEFKAPYNKQINNNKQTQCISNNSLSFFTNSCMCFDLSYW